MGNRRFARRHPLMVGVILAVLAGLFMLYGAAQLSNDSDMRAHGVMTTATVVDFHTGKAFYYTVRFRLPDGRTITADTGEASDKPLLFHGDPIRVEYLPDDPTQVDQVGTLGSQSVVWTGFVVGGALLLAVAIALLTPARRFLIGRPAAAS